MSVLLLASSFVTTLLIPPAASSRAARQRPRAGLPGAPAIWATASARSTTSAPSCILWFAGASAMAGLLNIVPRYLPRYGMAPDWARATRPLVHLHRYLLRCHPHFPGQRRRAGRRLRHRRAGRDDLGHVAVTLSASAHGKRLGHHRFRRGRAHLRLYDCVNTVIERAGGPEDRRRASSPRSSSSRWSRACGARPSCACTEVVLDDTAQRFIDEASAGGDLRIIANHPDERNAREYLLKEREQRADNHIPPGEPVLFLEVDRARCLGLRAGPAGARRGDRRATGSCGCESAAVPNAIAAILLWHPRLRPASGRMSTSAGPRATRSSTWHATSSSARATSPR